MTGCTKKIALEKGEFLLFGSTVRGSKQISADRLEALIPQKPNRRILRLPFTPYLYFYRIGERTYDKKAKQDALDKLNTDFEQQVQALDGQLDVIEKLRKKRDRKAIKLNRAIQDGNFLMRVLGEPPSYFTERDAVKNTNNLLIFLKNNGLFDAEVSYKTDTLLINQIRVTYTVTENRPYMVRDTSFLTTDSRIDSILQVNNSQSFVKKGVRYNGDALAAEAMRIETLLRNSGYFGFSRNYFKAQALFDSTRYDSLSRLRVPVDLRMRLNNPPRRQSHPYYYFDKVRMIVNGSFGDPTARVDTFYRSGVEYLFIGQKYSTKVLGQKIAIKPNKLYSQAATLETQRMLYNLEHFKFANITHDTIGNRISTDIYAVPLEKYQFTSESGATVFQQVPGPFTNVTLKVRNIFHGLESLETNVRAGFEGQTGFIILNQNQQVYRSTEIGINSSIIFPKIFFPGRFVEKLSRINPRTQAGVGFNYSSRPEYNRTNFKLAMNYSWQKSAKESFTVSLLDLNYVQTAFKSDTFRRYLEYLQNVQGNNLIVSFRPSFVSSISGVYTYNDNVLGANLKAKYFRLFLESGGTSLNFLSQGGFKFLDNILGNLTYFQFLKINTDFRYYLPIGRRRRSTLAMRLNTGVAWAYNKDSPQLPYEKYFFAGGSNSIRAWIPRRLGPGGVPADRLLPNGQVDYTFERPGDVLLESSLELRFPLLKLGGSINGAFFVDAGNVWTLSTPDDRPNTDFRFNRFYKEIAVGSGFGVRWDFNFFIIRADWGIKVIEPARPVGQRFVFMKEGINNPMVFNLGIGYPF
jgi:outer membrane protein assembly factor BamA